MLYVIVAITLVIIDQITKHFAIVYLKGHEPIELIKDYLYLTYLENKGAAFGMLNSKPMLFTILAIIFVIGMTMYILKNRHNIGSFYKLGFAIIIAGALGNLIDRLRFGYVVDFIFSPLGGLYDFPVFNFADIYLTCTAIVLLLYSIFFDKESYEWYLATNSRR